ncbi:MAG: DUF87 domain-containing protein [Candidatus Caldarchaeum sp.]|uniref:ATP-binding protein n=1 Tax=Caldiarchaeum subterraneum TaxID=311458 RepID=A0A7J3G6S6_CALS0
MEITFLGAAALVLNYALAFTFLFMVREGNAPEIKPVKSLRALIVGRVFFAIMLALMAWGPIGSGPASIAAPIAYAAKSLGAYYFILSLVLDLVIAAVFAQLEYHKAFTIVLANLPSIPMVTTIASIVAVAEQASTIRRVRRDVETGNKESSAVLGTVSKSVRMVEQPYRETNEDAQLKTHILVRTIPGNIELRYSPVVSEREFNPHMIIAGASGAGKTTTVFSLVTQLMGSYKVLLFDVKGDFTEAFYKLGYVDDGRAAIYMVSHTGIDPFKALEGETEPQMVEDLMDSISVLEEVGSKQAHFIRVAYAELRHANIELTYENLMDKLEKVEREIMEGKLKYGPQTKDAIEGIYDKMYDLKTVFKTDAYGVSDLYSPLFAADGPSLVVLNMADVNEKTRAIVLEFLLRKLAKMMLKRGPLAFTREKPVVVVIDEAYLVTKPIQLRGGRDSGSRSKLEDIARTARSYAVALILVTQRLSDIADGIRQSCYRWVVFNTSSPEDVWVLSQTSPESIRRVITELGIGEAYIRFVTPARIRTLSRQDPARIIVDGYIFKMRREKLGGDKAPGLPKPCSECGRVLTSDGRCLGKHVEKKKQEKETKERTLVKATNTGEEPVEEKQETRKTDTQEFDPEEFELLSNVIAAKELAIKRTINKEAAEILRKLPTSVAVRFCRNWKDKSSIHDYIKYGLVWMDGTRYKKTIPGILLLKHFEEMKQYVI